MNNYDFKNGMLVGVCITMCAFLYIWGIFRMPILHHEPEWYLPAYTRGLEQSEVRKEYSRLRKQAKKRVAAFERTRGKKLDLTRSQGYKYISGRLPKLKEIKPEQLPYYLSNLARWINKPYSSVLKHRAAIKQKIAHLHETGYEFVNESNYFDFVEFMEEFRAQKLDHVIGSPTAADLFNTVVNKGISPDEVYSDFMSWLVNQEKLESLPVKKTRTLKHYKLELKKNGMWSD